MIASSNYYSAQQYSTALTKSIELEKKGDYLWKAGRPELAMRSYNKSLALQEKIFGNDHELVDTYQTKLLQKDDGWKKTASRPGFKALTESLKHEKQGDYLSKCGRDDKAKIEYQKALTIERKVLGKDHARVRSVEQKLISARAA